MNIKNLTNPKKDENQKKGSALAGGLGLAVAMALGATLGILFAPKEGAETQKDLVEKAQQLARQFNKNREDVQATVKNIFGEVSDELEKNYLEVQGDILAQLDELKGKTDLTQKKYNEMIADTVSNFSKGKKWSKNVIKNLQDSFGDAWEEMNGKNGKADK